MAITASTSEPATARCDPDGSSATRYGRRIALATVREPVSDLLDTLVRLLARQAVAEAMTAESNKTDSTHKEPRP
jgi:hypothetical protein